MRKLILTAIALLLGITTTQALRAESTAMSITEYGNTGRTGRCTDNLQATSPTKGARAKEEQDQLFPSYWRNERTGDWEIAFFDDCAIYRSKYWTYKQREVDSKAGEARLLLSNGTDDLAVSVGKDRKGTRTMRIGKQKVTCSRLTDRYLPDYPTKDTRTEFVNSGYRHDTITLTGWIKDIPENYSLNKTVTFRYSDFFSDGFEDETVTARLDTDGRFTAKLPVVNTTKFWCEWADQQVFISLLEPGKTYFMLYVPHGERCYFMGEDVRLQNEFLRHAPDNSTPIRMEKGGDFDKFLASADSFIQTNTARIDRLCNEHPTLSTRFKLYRQGEVLWKQTRNIGQSRFNGKDYRLPDNVRKYATDIWAKLPEPLTLHPDDVTTFIRDYLGDAIEDRPSPSISFYYRDHLSECASNDEERVILARWEAFQAGADFLRKVAKTPEEFDKMREEYSKSTDPALFDKASAIFRGEHVRNVSDGYNFRATLKDIAFALDSLQVPSLIKDMHLCRQAYNKIGQSCRPLPEATMDTLKALVTTPITLEWVEHKNNYTKDILNNRVVKETVLETPEPIETGEGIQGIDSTDGKALLQSILAPLKGRFVLLDVWGTWCGPCRMALKDSEEEYERLKAFDIVYLYLANSSPKEEWENVIKMYNVNGENVVHYNLPREQQQAIEQYLNVHSYPNYKLFDREGNLLDMKVDARQLPHLENILKQLSRQ